MSGSYIPAALRRTVRERAQERCEYCLVPETIGLLSHQVDHIIAEKHGGATESDNLALSCTLCNRHKGSDLTSIDPETGAITPLFHPRRDRWTVHFLLRDAYLVPLTATARVTIRLLQLNHLERVPERALLLASGAYSLPD